MRMQTANPETTPDDGAPGRRRVRLSLRKKLLFSLVTVVAFFAVLELLPALCGFRPATSMDDPFVGFSGYAPLFIKHGGDDADVHIVTAPAKLTWFNTQEFSSPKPPGAYRIFCLGGPRRTAAKRRQTGSRAARLSRLKYVVGRNNEPRAGTRGSHSTG
jgi:hypothetical protein